MCKGVKKPITRFPIYTETIYDTLFAFQFTDYNELINTCIPDWDINSEAYLNIESSV
jgi:hypothetical protein